MYNKILIQNANIQAPTYFGEETLYDVYIQEGQIYRITKSGETSNDDKTCVTLDIKGNWIFPGLIDINAEHLETYAYLNGGFVGFGYPKEHLAPYPLFNEYPFIQKKITSFIDPHNNTLQEIYQAMHSSYAGITNNKYFISDTNLLLNLYRYAAGLNLKVFISLGDPYLLNGCMHAGAICSQLGLPGISILSETIDLQRQLALIEESGVQAHIQHISSEKSLDLIAQVKDRLPITVDVPLTHLLFNDSHLEDFDTHFHLYPVLRTRSDQTALLEGVLSGLIDVIAIQHQPVKPIDKIAPFAESKPGQSTAELVLPLLMSLANNRSQHLQMLINAVSINPAKVLGIAPTDCLIREGTPAFFSIFSPNAHWVVNEDSLSSLGYNTPFFKQIIQGQTTHTILKTHIFENKSAAIVTS